MDVSNYTTTCSGEGTIESTSLNEQDGTVTMNLKLGNKDSVDIQNIPVGTSYSVKENLPQGSLYQPSYSINGKNLRSSGNLATGTVQDGGTVCEVTNEHTILVQVLAVDEEGNALPGAQMKIQVDEEKPITWISEEKSNEIRGITEEGTYTIEVTSAPAGYAITEEVTFSIDENGNVTSDNMNENNIIEVKFKKTEISINPISAGEGMIADVEIKILDKDDKEVEKWESEQSIHTIEGLAIGDYKIKIVSVPSEYIQPDKDMFTFTIKDDGTVMVEEDSLVSVDENQIYLTITKKTGSPTVTNTVVSDLATDAEVDFSYTVTLADTTISGTYGDMEFKEGVATFTLKSGESKTASGLPTTLGYTVEQATVEGFETKSENVTGEISAAGSTVTFTNTRETGSLTVTNTVKSDLATDAEVDFSYTVTLADTTISGTYGDMEFEEGVATFTLKGGESKKAEGLPISLGYTVEQATVEGFETKSENVTGEISADGSTVTFINTSIHNIYNLKISNSVRYNAQLKDASSIKTSNANKEFKYTLTLTDSDNVSFKDATVKKNGEDTPYTTNDKGVYEFYLKSGEFVNISTSTAAIKYTIVQDDYTDDMFRTKIDGELGLTAGGTIGQEAEEIKYENIMADVAVKCNIEGASMKLSYDKADATYLDNWKCENASDMYLISDLQTLVDTVDVATSTTYKIEVSDVPYGYKMPDPISFTVDTYGNVYLYDTDQPTIERYRTIVINSTKLETTDITIKNLLKGNSAESDKEFRYTISVNNRQQSKEETFTLKGGESNDIGWIVSGDEFTVTQTGEPFYTTTYRTDTAITETTGLSVTGKAGTTVGTIGKVTFHNTTKEIKIAAVDVNSTNSYLGGAQFEIGKNISFESIEGKPYSLGIPALGSGTHKISVTNVPAGYHAITEEVEFTIDEKGTVTSDDNMNENNIIEVKYKKTEISVNPVSDDEEMIADVEIEIFDKDDKKVKEWVSEQSIHTIEGLAIGDYKIKIVSVPSGYIQPDKEFAFTIKDDGTVMVEEDSLVSVDGNAIYLTINKIGTVDISVVDEEGEALAGASVNIMKEAAGETWEIVETFKSGDEAKTVQGLLVDTTYTVVAEGPNGKVPSRFIQFIIKGDGSLTINGEVVAGTAVTLPLAKVAATVTVKTDDIPTEYGMAKWQLYKENDENNKYEKYAEAIELGGTSSAEDIPLPAGMYKLQEIKSPDNYKAVKEYIVFQVFADGQVFLLESEGEKEIKDKTIHLQYQSTQQSPEDSDSSSSSVSDSTPSSSQKDEDNTQENLAEDAQQTTTGQADIYFVFILVSLFSAVMVLKIAVSKKRNN